MEKLLSIVIPVYNVEKYIRKCLDSLILPKEQISKLEVLVVNDGSKDDSLSIAKEYEDKYPDTFRVINKANGNYGSVLNCGFQLARGKYFRTLDSDDWYNSKGLELFLNSLLDTDADLIFSERSIYHQDTKETEYYKFDNHIPVNADLEPLPDFWKNDSFLKIRHVSSITYKTEVLRKANMHCDEGVFYTDTEYDVIPLKYVQKVRFVPISVYTYVVGSENQSTNEITIRKNFHSLDVVANRLLDELLSDVDLNDNFYLLRKSFLVEELFLFYLTLRYDGLKHKKEVDIIENKLRKIPDIYKVFNNEDLYFGPNFIRIYRKGIVQYLLRRFLFQLKQNPSLRKLFRKPVY